MTLQPTARQLILGAAVAVFLGFGALPAQACLPPLPRTAEERAADLAARQDEAWSQATLIFEVEVGRVYSVSPAPGGPPIEPALRVELVPTRLLRGEGELRAIEISYPMRCGVSIEYPTSPGTRLVAWSRSASVDDVADVVDILPADGIVNSQILALLATP